MNFITFWIRKESEQFYSVKVIQSMELEFEIKLSGIFDVVKLGRLMRFWVNKCADLAETWKEEFTKADWEITESKSPHNGFRTKFKKGLGHSLERVFKNQWRNIYKRMNIIHELICCSVS